MTKTGHFATPEQLAAVRRASHSPRLVLAGMVPCTPTELAHALAISHGLPDSTDYYRLDLATGEFLLA